jgi:Fe2+ transport system protein FeoA
MNLTNLKRHQKAVIRENNVKDLRYRKRLMELGIVPDVIVEVVSRSKLHGPVVIRINEMNLAIEFKDAAEILAEVIE